MTTSKYAFDPAFLPLVPALPTVTDFSDPKVLAEMRGARPELFGAPPPDRDDVTKRDLAVPGRKGAPDVPIRIYAPKPPGSGSRGCIFEIHGGGFMMGSIQMMDPWCQAVAAYCDAVVVSVDYRLAPEHPFPAGVEDCYAALTWTAAHAQDLDVDPTRLAVGGGSAGGGLAAAVALMARDRRGPRLCYQLLIYPVIDDRMTTPSSQFTDV